MSSDKMREEFEAWRAALCVNDTAAKASLERESDGYYSTHTELAWMAWQAATCATQRDAMAVAEAVRRKSWDMWGRQDFHDHPEEVDLAAIVEAVRPSQHINWEWQHPDDTAVDRFQLAMRQKLATSRAKGRNGWDDPAQCSVEYLAKLLIEHLTKGNDGTFVDVANFAMMLHQSGADPAALARAAQQSMTDRYSDILNIQRDECTRYPSDSYMIGLYNGMLMMCCNADGTDYQPISVKPYQQQGDPAAYLIDWPNDPELGHYFAEEPTDTGRCRALYTVSPAPACSVPEGWQLVPKTATSMQKNAGSIGIERGGKFIAELTPSEVALVYHYVLAAAPKPEGGA